MSRHSDDGPPGGVPGGPLEPPTPAAPLPDRARGPAAPLWTAPPGETAPPVEPEPTLPRWARRDVDPTDPDAAPAGTAGPAPGPTNAGGAEGPGEEMPNIVPGPSGPARRLPDLTTPPTEGPGRAGTERLRGFRRRAVPAPAPHRQEPAIEAATSGGPSPDPSESRTIAPGQLAPGIRGQLGPGPTPPPTPARATTPGPLGQTAPAGSPIPPGSPTPSGTTGPTGAGGSPDMPGAAHTGSTSRPLGTAGPIGSAGPLGTAGTGGITDTSGALGPTRAGGSTDTPGPAHPAGTPGPRDTAGSAGPLGPPGSSARPDMPASASTANTPGPLGPPGSSARPDMPASATTANTPGPLGAADAAGAGGSPFGTAANASARGPLGAGGSAGPFGTAASASTPGPLGAGGGAGPFGTGGPLDAGGAFEGGGGEGGVVSQGQQVVGPVGQAPIPRAQAGQEPPDQVGSAGSPGGIGGSAAGTPGEPTGPGPRGFPVPPELPSPPQRPRADDPGAIEVAGEPKTAPAPATPAPRTASGAPRPGQVAAQPRRLTPEQIRITRFGRSPLGRRGYNEDEVNQFTNRLAEELAARDAEVVRLIDENHRLKQAMRDWQRERIGQPDVDVAERVNAETAELMAKAQQQIDAQLAQTELYCRQREQEAVRRYDEIVRHARLQVKREAEQVAQRYRATSGAGYNPDQETLQRQQVYIGALLQALDALGAHVQATRQAFATEIGKLGESSAPAAPAAAPPDPLTQRVD